EALATFQRLLGIRPNLGRWGLGFTYAAMGRDDDVRRVLAELSESPGQKDIMVVGLLHGALGERDRAMDWLERAYDERVDWLPWVGTAVALDPFFGAGLAPLREDPRYRDLVAKLDLPRPR